MQLCVPGPTPLPPEVRRALGREMISHRSPEFQALMREVTAELRKWFGTEGDVLILTVSGTGVLEAAVVNVLSPGDRVLAVSVGIFGQRFASIARSFGAEVCLLEFPLGQAADPQVVAGALAENPGYRAVLVTHNETSTGVTNDVAAIADAIAAAVKASEGDAPFLLVDAVSSLGGLDFRMDDWGCDVVATSSQKAFMTPPGLGFIAMSAEAWKATETARMPRYYLDLRRAREYAERGETPYTPAITTLYGLHEALRLMATEGKERILERHCEVGRAMRRGVVDLGLGLLADAGHASDTVTAVKIPSGLDAQVVIKRLSEEHGVVVASGQGSLKGKIIRIGHMGYTDLEDVERVVEALRAVIAA
jgi:aspartate aminotransferase-like enzyme